MNNITNIETSARTAIALSGLIMATVQDRVGIVAQDSEEINSLVGNERFFFDFEEGQSIESKAEVTKHFTERGLISDNINLNPEIISTRGFVGELVYAASEASLEVLRTTAESAYVLQSLAPEMAVEAQRAYIRVRSTMEASRKVWEGNVQKWASISESNFIVTGSETSEELQKKIRDAGTQTRQQKSFQKLYGYQRAKKLFTVQTPWGIFKNCALTNLKATREENSEDISTFQCTFEVMKFAVVESSANEDILWNPNYMEEKIKNQMTPHVDKGLTSVGTMIS